MRCRERGGGLLPGALVSSRSRATCPSEGAAAGSVVHWVGHRDRGKVEVGVGFRLGLSPSRLWIDRGPLPVLRFWEVTRFISGTRVGPLAWGDGTCFPQWAECSLPTSCVSLEKGDRKGEREKEDRCARTDRPSPAQFPRRTHVLTRQPRRSEHWAITPTVPVLPCLFSLAAGSSDEPDLITLWRALHFGIMAVKTS